MKNKSLKHWLVLLTQCLMVACSIGLAVNAVGVFYPAVTGSLNVLSGSFAMHSTLQVIMIATTSLFMPNILKKINFKIVLTVGALGIFITTFLMGLSYNLVFFNILGFFRGIFLSFCGGVMMNFIINNWFYQFNGIALSIAFSFSGIAGSVASKLLTEVIAVYGWNTAYFVKAIVMFLLCVPAILFPYHMNPKDDNLLPYGYKPDKNEAIKASTDFNYYSVNFIMFFIFSITVTMITGLPQHFINFSKSVNLDVAIGAGMLSYAMLGNITFKLVIGFLNDSIGTIKSILLMIIINIISIVLIIEFKQYEIGAFLLGSIYSIASVGISLLCLELFKKENYVHAFPLASFAGTFGSAVALSLIGYLYDFTGTYNYAFIAALIINLLAIINILFVSNKLKLKK